MGAVVRFISADIQADWIRVVRDIKVSSGQCVTWFKGRDPALTPAAFEQRWCRNGILAKVGVAPGGRLYLHIKLCMATAPTMHVL